jgi:hypothetical protein
VHPAGVRLPRRKNTTTTAEWRSPEGHTALEFNARWRSTAHVVESARRQAQHLEYFVLPAVLSRLDYKGVSEESLRAFIDDVVREQASYYYGHDHLFRPMPSRRHSHAERGFESIHDLVIRVRSVLRQRHSIWNDQGVRDRLGESRRQRIGLPDYQLLISYANEQLDRIERKERAAASASSPIADTADTSIENALLRLPRPFPVTRLHVPAQCVRAWRRYGDNDMEDRHVERAAYELAADVWRAYSPRPRRGRSGGGTSWVKRAFANAPWVIWTRAILDEPALQSRFVVAARLAYHQTKTAKRRLGVLREQRATRRERTRSIDRAAFLRLMSALQDSKPQEIKT